MLSAFVKVFAPVIKVVAKIIAPVVNVVNKVIQKVTGGQGTIAHIAQNVTNAVNTSANHKSDDKLVKRGPTGTVQTQSSNVLITNVPASTDKLNLAGDYTPMVWSTDQTHSLDGTGIFTGTPFASTGTSSVIPVATANDTLLGPLLTTQTLSDADILKANGTLATAQAQYDESFANFLQAVPDRFQISLDRWVKEGWREPSHTNAWSFLNGTFAPSVTKEEITDQAHSYFFDFKGTAATLDKVTKDVTGLMVVPGDDLGLITPKPKPGTPPVDDMTKEPQEYFPVMTETPDWKKRPTGESNPIFKQPLTLINKIYNEAEELAKFREWFKTTEMGQALEKARESLKKFRYVNFSGAEEEEENNVPEPEPVPSMGDIPYPEYTDYRTGKPVPRPMGPYTIIPQKDRVQREDDTYRRNFITDWRNQGIPSLDWKQKSPKSPFWIVHHILPLEFGGTHDLDNLAVVDEDFHTDEFNKYWREIAKWIRNHGGKMSEKTIAELISEIKLHPDVVEDFPGLEEPTIYRYDVEPHKPWDQHDLEQKLSVRLPNELISLWNNCAGIGLHEDITYRQWGIILWGPEQTLALQTKIRKGREEDFIKGDLVIGKFRGDDDLVVLRCDPDQPDFGNVLIALVFDLRKNWDYPAKTLTEFIERFLQSSGKKYWQ